MHLKIVICFLFNFGCVFSLKLNLLDSENELGTVIVANVLFRHGQRTPTESYPNDPYKNVSLWPEGWGQLTNTGKMQEYDLGKWLRDRFQHLLRKTYSRDEIYILSTDVDRTLMSAEATLAGLYPPNEGQIWNTNIKWQPIPVHTIPVHLDNVLGVNAPCPRYQSEFKKVLHLPQVIDLLASYSELMQYLEKNTGEEVRNLLKVQNICSTLFIETLHNYTLPEWTKKIYPSPIKEASTHLYALQTFNTELKKLKSGPLLKDMLQHFKVHKEDSLAGMTDEEFSNMKNKKVWIYSAHDDTVGSLLNSLGVYNYINPPFASCLLLELREKNNDYFITVTYRNSTAEEGGPFLFTIPGCEALCPYDKFIQLTSDIIPYDWETECKLNILFNITTEIPYSSVAIFVIVASTLLVLLLMASLSVFWKSQKTTRYYRKLKTDSI